MPKKKTDVYQETDLVAREKAHVQKRLWSIKEMEFLHCDLRLLTLTFCERYHIWPQRTCMHVNNTLHILLTSPA